MMKQRQPRSNHAGYTLMEMLVVMAVVVILVALLLPALARVKDKGKMLYCANNMRQIYQAMNLYASDYRGALPWAAGIGDTPALCPECAWAVNTVNGPTSQVSTADLNTGQIYKYLSNVLATRAKMMWCPSDMGDWPVRGCTPQVGVKRNCSYSLNYQINVSYVNGARSPRLLQWIPSRSSKVLITEELAPNDAYNLWNNCDDAYTRRHFLRANFIFADGHLELLRSDQVWATSQYCDLTQQ